MEDTEGVYVSKRRAELAVDDEEGLLRLQVTQLAPARG